MPASKPAFTSKASRDLGNVVQQLRTGKTRGSNPRDLEPAEIADLRTRESVLRAQVKEAVRARVVNRVNAHTSEVAERVVERVVESQDAAAAAVIDRVGGALSAYLGVVPSEGASAREKLHDAGKLHALSLARVKAAKAEVQREAEEERKGAEGAGMTLRAWRALRDRPVLADEEVRVVQDRASKKGKGKRVASEGVALRAAKAPRASPSRPSGSSGCTTKLPHGKRAGELCGRKLPCRFHGRELEAEVDKEAEAGQSTLSKHLRRGSVWGGEAKDGEAQVGKEPGVGEGEGKEAGVVEGEA